jgi:hypothetical protein
LLTENFAIVGYKNRKNRISSVYTQTQQREIAPEAVRMRHGIVAQWRHRLPIHCQIDAFIQSNTNESETGVRRNIRLGLRNDDPSQPVTY